MGPDLSSGEHALEWVIEGGTVRWIPSGDCGDAASTDLYFEIIEADDLDVELVITI